MQLSLEKPIKVLVAGLQGSGKTYLAKKIIKDSGLRTLVYTPHGDEWDKSDDVYLVKPDDFINDFEEWCKFVKVNAEEGKISCFMIDELDLIFKHHFDSSPVFRDLVINHRHYDLRIIGVTRRIQDIPTNIYNTFEVLCLFKIEAPQVKDLLNRYHEGLGDMVYNLDFEKHEFVVKKIGQAPKIAVA